MTENTGHPKPKMAMPILIAHIARGPMHITRPDNDEPAVSMVVGLEDMEHVTLVVTAEMAVAFGALFSAKDWLQA